MYALRQVVGEFNADKTEVIDTLGMWFTGCNQYNRPQWSGGNLYLFFSEADAIRTQEYLEKLRVGIRTKVFRITATEVVPVESTEQP